MNKMIDFDKAVTIAKDNLLKLLPDAEEIKLEGVLISEDDKIFEVTYSYLSGLDLENLDKNKNSKFSKLLHNAGNFSTLAGLMRLRRDYKAFLVDAQNGSFRGFKLAEH